MRDLEDSLAIRGLRIVRRLPDGLSGTQIFVAQSAEGPMLVKVLQRSSGAVDGHDEATFHRKRVQLELLSRALPAVADLHVPIVDELAGLTWCAQVLPFVEGTDLLTPIQGAAERIIGVLDRLALDGWRAGTDRTHPYLRNAHVGRIRRRWAFLASVAPPAALRGEGVRVNGVRCRSLTDLLADAEGLLPDLEPPRLCPPVHGDLNTRNVIVSRSGFRLVDPRGTLEAVDPCYDLGKILLSVSIWDPFVRDPDALTVEADVDGYRVAIPSPAGYQGLRGRLPELLAASTALIPVLGDRWQARLAFTHAAHAIAEAACRVSDARAKGASEEITRRHANGFLLFGMVLLEDAITRARRPDDVNLNAHLARTDLFTGKEGRLAVPVPCRGSVPRL